MQISSASVSPRPPSPRPQSLPLGCRSSTSSGAAEAQPARRSVRQLNWLARLTLAGTVCRIAAYVHSPTPALNPWGPSLKRLPLFAFSDLLCAAPGYAADLASLAKGAKDAGSCIGPHGGKAISKFRPRQTGSPRRRGSRRRSRTPSTSTSRAGPSPTAWPRRAVGTSSPRSEAPHRPSDRWRCACSTNSSAAEEAEDQGRRSRRAAATIWRRWRPISTTRQAAEEIGRHARLGRMRSRQAVDPGQRRLRHRRGWDAARWLDRSSPAPWISPSSTAIWGADQRFQEARRNGARNSPSGVAVRALRGWHGDGGVEVDGSTSARRRPISPCVGPSLPEHDPRPPCLDRRQSRAKAGLRRDPIVDGVRSRPVDRRRLDHRQRSSATRSCGPRGSGIPDMVGSGMPAMEPRRISMPSSAWANPPSIGDRTVSTSGEH